MKAVPIVVAVIGLFVLMVLGGAFYTVRETEIVILTQFGRPVGDPITTPGLHWKTPFVQDINRIEKRVLEFDGPPTKMPTKDKTYIEVDTFARWQIKDAAKFFVMVRDERSAQSRLEDIIGSEARASVASHDMIEVVRSDIKRTAAIDTTTQADNAAKLRLATRGRAQLEREILAAAAPKLVPLGIELLDVRIKRVNYNSDVLPTIYQRMTSERAQIAQRFRSEGEGEAARILGTKERDLAEIESLSYKQVQEIRGAADAEATRVYAEAYDKTPEAREFYGFLKTLDTYRTVLGSRTNLILSTDSELFRLLDQSAGK
ncbi:MAG: protease modulator HflC [Planctomycetes bacterium]|nr:protease modulator HflC [Planctomycetota bacterium]